MSESMRELAKKAIEQKERALAKGNGGYAITPHYIYRELMPELKAKYDARTARDCLSLYMFLQAHVNGEASKEYYMWAFPTNEQIVESTGIHKDRVKKLADILVSEGLMLTKRVPWYGHTKKLYLPLYERRK